MTGMPRSLGGTRTRRHQRARRLRRFDIAGEIFAGLTLAFALTVLFWGWLP
jgi:hypothetical protein